MANYSIELYNIDVANGGFTRTAELFGDIQDLEYNYALNAAGYASYKLNIGSANASPDLYLDGRTQAHIKRNGGSTGWFGLLIDIDGSTYSIDGSVTFTFRQYLHHLSNKVSGGGVIYSLQDASLIAADLVTDVQARTNGALNITTGSLPTVGSTTDALNYQEVLDALQNQSDNVVGYDFDITPTFDADNLLNGARLNIYKGKGIQLNNLPPVNLQRAYNIRFSRYKEFFNHVTVLGGGTGDQVVAVTAENASSQIAYTRREKVIKSAQNLSVASLQALADAYIVANSVPRTTIQFSLDSEVYPVGSINVGDILNINIYEANTFLDFQGTARVIELTIGVDENGKETITPRIDFSN